jgi:parvulin-like peptidyl-prolyl isomerase
MKKLSVLLILLLAGAALLATLREHRRHESLQSVWRALRFRDRDAPLEAARAGLSEDARLRAERLKAGFQADVSEELAKEMDIWRKQFHLGGQDRAERLAMQGLDEPGMRERIRDCLLDQAFLEQRGQPVPEPAVQAWFESYREQLRIPELVHVSHIFLSAHDPKKPDRRPEIQAISASLAAGEPFAGLATRHSEDARSRPSGGDLGWCSPARMPADIMAALAQQSLGKAGAPVRSRLGWHIFLVHERRASRIPVLEEVRAEISALLDLRQRDTGAVAPP